MGGREGTPAEECAVGRGAGVPRSRLQDPAGRARRESSDHVLFISRRRRDVPGPGQPSVGWTGGPGELMAAQGGQAGACWRPASGQGAGDPRLSFGSVGPTLAAASSPVLP